MSQKHTEEFEIGGYRYIMNHWAPDTVDDCVWPIAHSSLGSLLAQEEARVEDLMAHAVASLSKDQMKLITRKLSESTHYVGPDTDGKKVSLEKTYAGHFRGRYKSLMAFRVKGLKAQLSEFFTDGVFDLSL